MVEHVDADQTVLHLPGCRIYSFKAFRKITDARVSSGYTAVCFTADDSLPAYIDGWQNGGPSISIGQGGAVCKVTEVGPSGLCVILFEPGIFDRGWPETAVKFIFITITLDAQQSLRDLVLAAFEFTLGSPDEMAVPAIGFRESFIAVIDGAISSSNSYEADKIAGQDPNLDLVRKIDAYLSDHVSEPIYSEDLAKTMGVSMRTLHNATVQYSGLSPHRYLRHKRLWLVRKQLIDGGQSIKACALAHGFWHMGDFTRVYRAQFGETPSHTVARADANG